MKALTYHGPYDLRVERVADPEIRATSEVLVTVQLAAICGSDLHVWHGREKGLDPGTVMGHEFLGTVLEVGSAVRGLRRGDRVVSPFTTCCGECFYCTHDLPARCERGQLFGWIERGTGLHGGQAQMVRVPLASTTLVRLPEDLSAEAGIVLGDVLATGYHCAVLARVEPGTIAAVIGCGPVGLMAVLAARERGAARVFAVDSVPERLLLAERMGAEPVSLGEGNLDILREATGGRGPDAVLEAVGTEGAARLAFDLVRTGGTIGAVGVHHEPSFPFSPGQAYDKNLTVSIGRCPARLYMDRLIPVARKREAELQALFTHRSGLDDAASAYGTFDSKALGCIKVALLPN